MADDTPTVHEAITAVMQSVGVIGKNQRADRSMGGYAFRGIDDIRNRLAQVLPEHGVIIAPHSIDDVHESSYTTKSGSHMRLVRVQITYRVYGPGGDHIDVPGIGEAADTSDKAATQASTTAYKYMVITLMSIASEGEQDADSTSEQLEQGGDLAARAQQKATEQANFDPAPEDVVRGLLQDATKVWADKDNARGEVWKRLHHEASERGLPAPESFRDIHPDLLGPVGKWVGEQTQAARDPDSVAEEVPF